MFKQLITRRRKPVVLLATRNSAALRAAWAMKAEVREALSTDAAYKALSGVRLAVLDAEHLEPGSVPVEKLLDVLKHAGAVVCSGDEFANSPQTYWEQALSALGALSSLPPRAVVVTGYGGGVGKTTLSLDLAAFVADRLRLTAALVEVGYGASALRALLSDANPLPDFYAVVTQGESPGVWRRATLLPMEYRTARLLLNRPEVAEKLAAIKQQHVLTVFDAAPMHPFFDLVCRLADQVLIVSDARPDCIVNAAGLVEDLSADVKTRIVFNRQRGLADRALGAGVDHAVSLPEISNPSRFDGRLARRLLPVIYPGWKG